MKTIRKLFPFTKRGLFFILVCLIILAVGIINSDLAALFWSAGILTVLILAFISIHITYYLLNRKRVCLNLKVPVNSIFPGDEITIRLETELPEIFIPGIIILFNISFNWQNRKPVIFSQILNPGKNCHSLFSKAIKRGYFETERFKLIVRDYFGFFKSFIFFNIDEKIPVLPNQINADEILNSFRGIDSLEYLKKREITDEFYEIRKYYPGDDPKKLNWKMFAHSNELFIRKEEETPPPKSNILFIIDLYKTQIIDRKYADEYLDSLIELANSIILLFLKDNLSAMVYIPGYGDIHTINSTNELLILLSKVYWNNYKDINLPVLNNNFNTVLFSTTDSYMLKNLLENIKKSRWSVNLYFKLFKAPVMEYKSLSFKDIFYYNLPAVKTIDSEYSKSINKIILNEIIKYKREPWNLANVKAL